ncbi:MAG: tetratricopeptide repeat protein [Bacteroidales bacterium]|nr:tetratricopeptide repeat protein [Bacteroidales bacterium]
MKRLLTLSLILILSSSVLYSQSRELRRANRQLGREVLDEAKEHLEAAKEHESVFSDPEFWMLKAQLHLAIAVSEKPEYRKLSDNPIGVADEALQKVQEFDENNVFYLEIQQAMLLLSELVFNEGVDYYNQEQWIKAADNFFRAYEINLFFDAVDTTTLYNAALSAELGRDLERAKGWYLDLKELRYDQPFIYSSLANISMTLGDTLQATEYIQFGREVYPEDLDLIFTEANIHIFTGDIEQAEAILNIAIERDPDNPSLYFAFGANYDKMAQDTTYTDEERLFAFNEAVKAYEKAIELNPDYFDAVYNLGVLYFNRGIRIFEEAEERLRETHDFRQYEEDEKMFRDAWLEAQPYLEQSMEMIDDDDPNLRIVVISLVELYARTNQPDKLEEIRPLYERFYGTEE